MKKTLTLIALCVAVFGLSSYAFDLKGLLNKGGKSDSKSDKTAQTIGGILGGVVDSLTGSSDINLDDLTGTWVYSSPAITLDSDNALQKIGGSAATGAIEKKLEPYYQRAGLTNMVLTVNEDHSFTMKMGFGTMTGTIEKNNKEGLIFKFKAFNQINLGKVKTMASKSATGLTITFDVSRIKGVVQKVSQVANNQTFKSLSDLLSTYDGVYAGFRLTREK